MEEFLTLVCFGFLVGAGIGVIIVPFKASSIYYDFWGGFKNGETLIVNLKNRFKYVSFFIIRSLKIILISAIIGASVEALAYGCFRNSGDESEYYDDSHRPDRF